MGNMCWLEKLLDKVHGHLFFEKTANPVVESEVQDFFAAITEKAQRA
jgi:hypothetical protein